MNFASWTFILVFLPVVVGGFLVLGGRDGGRRRQAWLIAASAVFYGASGLSNLAVLGASILVNYAAGRALGRVEARAARRAILWTAIAANVGTLLLFKVSALERGFEGGFLSDPQILIPLALSFITFQQIGFVVACYRDRTLAPSLFDYLFFILFFPQLIMGPILQYRPIARQLRDRALARASAQNLAVGLAIFILGLAQKVLLADPLAGPVERVFAAALAGPVGAADAWFGIIGFQFQLFLDFSAYAEMSIGLGRLFGIALPINFDAPLKAVNRFDLWRRWHITFVVFMRSHVFMPLVRHWHLPAWAALAATAFLSGVWHGLGWTFILWGAVQTAILLALHWRARRKRQGAPTGAARVRAIALTFLVTCLIGALFRAPSLEAAGSVYLGLALQSGSGPGPGALALALLAASALLVWGFPEPNRLFGGHWTAFDPRPDADSRARRASPPVRLQFRTSAPWGLAMAVLLVACLLMLGQAQRFVYVQF